MNNNIERMIILENFITDNNIDKTSNVIEYSKGVGCSYEETIYVIHAILLPKTKFKNTLAKYENLPLDKREKLINELSKEHNTSPQIIIKRLKEIKAITEYQEVQIQKQTQINTRKRKK